MGSAAQDSLFFFFCHCPVVKRRRHAATHIASAAVFISLIFIIIEILILLMIVVIITWASSTSALRTIWNAESSFIESFFIDHITLIRTIFPLPISVIVSLFRLYHSLQKLTLCQFVVFILANGTNIVLIGVVQIKLVVMVIVHGST